MIGVIGCGNMAQAIVKGYYSRNKSAKFLTYTPSYTRAEDLAKSVNGHAVKELIQLNEANTIVLACKPQQLNELASNLKSSGIDLSSKHLISILAATPIETIREKINANQVTRIMPNTPSMIGCGMSLVLHSDNVTEEQKKLVSDFFSSVGEIAQMPDEKTFDQVTTVSGSGPAYVFLFAKTMANKLLSWGVDEESARAIVIQLFRGSSELMHAQKDLSFDEQINKVTSKAGVTIEAVNSFYENEIDLITSKALDAAYKRSIEIEAELKQS